MQRYWEAVEADFCQRYPGEDLRYLWQSRQWRKLGNLIERLPYNSHLRQAQLNDTWYVAQVLEAKAKRDGGDPGPTGVAVTDWSPEVATLSSLGNDIRDLSAAVKTFMGAKTRPKPYDGPSTVVKKAEMARRQQKHDELVKRMIPGRKA